MTLTSIYSAQTSRREGLNYFAYAIEKGHGRKLAFLSLDKKDRIALLALCKFKGSTVSWKKIGKETLRNAVQHLLHGPRLPNLLQLPPQEMTKAHITPFLTLKDLANLQSTHKAAPGLSNASSIIKSYDLAPLIARYCHQDCEILSESGKIQAFHQLMSMVQELSKLEELELPSYQSIRKFFELVEARNLLRMAAQMDRDLVRIDPFARLNAEQLKIAEDSASTLQRAETVRAWFRGHQAGLQAIIYRLGLQNINLTLLPPEIGQLRALSYLDLSNNHLTSLPKEIGQLRALTELRLDDNHLTSLPKESGQLSTLNYLDLSNNRLTSLPKEIGQLGALTLLSLSDNCLTSLPKEIGQLRALMSLLLKGNRMTNLSKEIGQLKALNVLNVSNNRLTSLPKEIGQLKALNYLVVQANYLTFLPNEIGQLGALTWLKLGNNRLVGLPKKIDQLRALYWLKLDNNRLTSLPKEIGQLGALASFEINGNRLINLPKKIGQLRALTHLAVHDNYLTFLPNEIGQIQVLEKFSITGNGLLYLPAKLSRFNDQLQKQDQTLQLKTILGQLGRCLKGKHNCRAILALLDTMEKFQGKEIRSKLHACIYEVCKKEKSLHKKLKSPQFGRKAFVDPTIDPKFKLAALKRFEKMLHQV